MATFQNISWPRSARVDPYLPQLIERWEESLHTVAGLHRELVGEVVMPRCSARRVPPSPLVATPICSSAWFKRVVIRAETRMKGSTRSANTHRAQVVTRQRRISRLHPKRDLALGTGHIGHGALVVATESSGRPMTPWTQGT